MARCYPGPRCVQHIAAAGYQHVGLGAGRDHIPQVRGKRRWPCAKRPQQAGVAPLADAGQQQDRPRGWTWRWRIIDGSSLTRPRWGARWILELGTDRTGTARGLCRTHAPGWRPMPNGWGVGITMKPHGGISLTVQDLLADLWGGGTIHPLASRMIRGNIIYYTKGELRPRDRYRPDCAGGDHSDHQGLPDRRRQAGGDDHPRRGPRRTLRAVPRGALVSRWLSRPALPGMRGR